MQQTLCRSLVLLVDRGSAFGRRGLFVSKMPPKHISEPRGCPCRNRAPRSPDGRIRATAEVRDMLGFSCRVWVMSGVGLVRADVQG